MGKPLIHAWQQLLTWADQAALAEPADGDLVRRFVASGDEAAFAALVRRHGPMVLGLCQRVLRHREEAEDAFQATFLVLARKASTIHNFDAVGPWLHRVATRLACQLRQRLQQRRTLPWENDEMPQPAANDPVNQQEVNRILDEELDLLSERDRALVVLCHLQGLSHQQAARQTGLAAGSVWWRLRRALDRLRTRLRRRGLVLSGAALLAVLAEAGHSSAAAPLLRATVAAGLAYAAGLPATVSSRATLLAEEVLRTMLLTRLKRTLVLLALLCGLGAAALLSGPDRTEAADKTPPPTAEPPKTDLPIGAVGQLGDNSFKMGHIVTALAMCPDGKHLASASPDTLCVWDALNGQRTWRVGPLPGRTTKLAYTPDGKYLLAGVADHHLYVFDPATGKELWHLSSLTSSVAFLPSHDSRSVIVALAFGKLERWDLAACKQLASYDKLDNEQVPLALSPDGKQLATRGYRASKEVKLWDLDTGKELGKWASPGESVWYGATCKEGVRLASLDTPGFTVWEPGDKVKPRQLRAKNALALGLSFSPDGKYVAVGNYQGPSQVYEAETGKLLHETNKDMPRETSCIAVSPDGRRVACGTGGGGIYLWDGATEKVLAPGGGHQGFLTDLSIAPDGKTALTVGTDYTVRQWDLATRKEVNAFVLGHGPVTGLFAGHVPGGKQVYCGGYSLPLLVLEESMAKAQDRYDGDKAGFHSAALSSDGRLAAAGEQGKVRVWDRTTAKELPALATDQKEWIMSMAFIPGTQRLATLSHDRLIRVWDVPSAKVVETYPTNATHGIALLPGGYALAAISSEREVVILEATTHKARRTFTAPEGSALLTAAVSPNGRLIAAGCQDGSLHLWDVATGKHLRHFEGQDGSVGPMAFTPEGKYLLVAGSYDVSARIHDVSSYGKPAAQPVTREEVERQAKQLASLDAKEAAAAIDALASAPAESLPLLKKALQATAPVEKAQIEQWLKDLDADRFATRRKAAEELERVADQFAPLLKETLKNTRSAEVRRALEAMVGKLDGPQSNGRMLEILRAIETLERIGGAEATAALKDVAKSKHVPQVVQAAAEAVQRLSR